MYLVIFDKFTINDESRNFYFCSNDYFAPLKEKFPNLINITNEDIDEILIYSKAKDDLCKKVKISKCSKIEISETSIRIHYSNIEELECTCESVKKKLYGYSIKNHILSDKNDVMNVVLLEDINEYVRIKGERKENEQLNLLAQIEQLKMENKWKLIIDLFPNKDNIQESIYWSNYSCLSELAFALAMHCKLNYNRYFENYFLLLIERCKEIYPSSNSIKSLEAYYFYDKYTNRKLTENFFKAEELYKSILENDKTNYKELYRYTKLRQTHFESVQWKGDFGDQWINKAKEIINDYRWLIENFESLDEEKQKAFRKYYIKSIFGYCAFCIDMFLNYWEHYFNHKTFAVEIKQYILSERRKLEIINISNLLSKLHTFCGFENVSIDHIKEKPNYFDIMYRIAQINQITGIYNILTGQDKKIYEPYFAESNKIISNILKVANTYSQNSNVKFNYPHYVKLPKAINHYFLKETEECHRCFYKSKIYMQFEEARIYILEGDKEKATKILSAIPDTDKCYNKSQKLLGKL